MIKIFGQNRSVKMMFIGDSITVGTPGAPEQVGFRSGLISRLTNVFPITTSFVGWNQSGSLAQSRMTGASGQRIDELYTSYLTYQIPAYSPDIVFIHMGTNDCTQINSGAWLGTITDSINSTSQCLDLIRAYNPYTRVFFSKIVPNQTAGANTLITQLISGTVTMISARSDNSYITYADHNGTFLANTNWATEWMADNTHPNAAGCDVMETVYWNAFDSIF